MEEANKKKKVRAANSVREGLESTSHQKSLVPRSKESDPTNLSQTKSRLQPRGPSGPRTATGKQRSKYNAIKHGIFADVVLPNEESRLKYESLLGGLFEHFSPQGRLEEVLVEKLAMLLWRHRRLIQAERAEIQNSTEFLELEEENRERQRLKEVHTSKFVEKLIDHIENPEILERCLILLGGLKKKLEVSGFEETSNREVLETIYGLSPSFTSLLTAYLAYSGASSALEKMGPEKGSLSPAAYKTQVLEGIDHEIRRLKKYQEMQTFATSKRAELARIRLQVPHSPDLDRLLRYEASLDRSFDRTLSQLERLQRMRLGQPVPPPFKVNLSS